MRTIKFRAWNTKHKYMDDTVFIRSGKPGVAELLRFADIKEGKL